MADATLPSAGEWVASLVVEGRLTSGTVKMYRSALSTLWEESTARGDNPFQSRQMGRLVRGAARELLCHDTAVRKDRGEQVSLTPDLLIAIGARINASSHTFGEDSPELCMMYAAACMGVCGLLRPNEFVGAYSLAGRALTASAVTWYAAPGVHVATDLLPRAHRVGDYARPDRFALSLGATKADQLAKNPPLVIGAGFAVWALWQWMHIRRAAGHSPHDPLFIYHAGRPLSCSALLAWLTAQLADARLLPAGTVLKGRSFRRGGASAMLEAGADISSIMTQGRWKSAAMVDTYSDAASKRARALLESRAMGSPAAVATVLPRC